MWFFGTKGTPRVKKRLSALEEDYERQERTLKGLRADMDLQWEKVQRLLGRLSKRAAMIEKATAEGETDGGQTSPTEGSLSEELNGLTPRQRALQLEILASRMRH